MGLVVHFSIVSVVQFAWQEATTGTSYLWRCYNLLCVCFIFAFVVFGFDWFGQVLKEDHNICEIAVYSSIIKLFGLTVPVVLSHKTPPPLQRH